MERLQKVLAHAGLASRREAERIVRAGRVTVNGAVADTLGVRVDAERDVIKVDGKRLPRAPAGHVYLMLHKPAGYVTTMSDPQGRPTVADLVRRPGRRVYPVGRLDYHSEGLLLLTDDGELARDLMHPGRGVEKTYRVKVHGRPADEALARLSRGVRIEGRLTAPARVRRVSAEANPWLEITVIEGRKHQVRRMCRAIGHPVQRLRRVRYGGLGLGRLAPGAVRALTSEEIRRLRRAAGREA